MKVSELREKSQKELETELALTQKELCSLRLQKHAGGEATAGPRTHSFLPMRRKIARIKTILHEKKS